MDISAIKDLLDRYLLGNASSAEQKIIEEWLLENDFPDNDWSRMEEEKKTVWMNSLQSDLEKKIQNSLPSPSGENIITTLRWYKKKYFPFAAAAFFMIVAGSWYFFVKEKPVLTPAVVATQATSGNDAMPGSDKAILTLDDGRTVSLDDSQNGILAEQGGIRISKNGAQIVYDDGKVKPGTQTTSYNILSTPRGGQYNLVLPDGSSVWLNAASSLKYPVAFEKNKREVEIKGEAYFEVATLENGKQKVPFTVKVMGLDGLPKSVVQVLGTHFNINAYDEEATVNTTLLEGKVKILPSDKTDKGAVVLTPGQQSQLNKQGGIKVIRDADIDEAVAWKNGLFIMNGAEIPVVLRQLGRWYDVDIIYNKGVPAGKISGDIPRNMKLSEVLKIMKLSGVDFKIEGRKIIVER